MILKTGKHFQDDTRAEFIYYGKLLSMEQMTSLFFLIFLNTLEKGGVSIKLLFVANVSVSQIYLLLHFVN